MSDKSPETDIVVEAIAHNGTLRDIVAEVISSVDDWRGVTDPAILADAVISALGLRQEWGALAHDDSGFLYDHREEVRPWKGETVKTRYITEWTDE